MDLGSARQALPTSYGSSAVHPTGELELVSSYEGVRGEVVFVLTKDCEALWRGSSLLNKT